MGKLNIVMYHYVRPIADSPYPGIKGLELAGFKRQLDYLTSEFTIVTIDQIKGAISCNKKLPSNACWLTFDDGYKDHYKYVLPELKARGLEGSFFPPAAAIMHHQLLDVNAVHHILASVKNIARLKFVLDEKCIERGITKKQLNKLWLEYGKPNRFDNATTIYIKRLLQHAIPEEIRNDITNALFKYYVGVKSEAFCNQLYMNEKEVSELVSSGMYVGSHGYKHYWLNRLSDIKQEEDLAKSLHFLEHVGAPTSDWVVCYPYGAYNSETLKIASRLGAVIGITTKVAAADLSLDSPLELPRYDTNDFPQ